MLASIGALAAAIVVGGVAPGWQLALIERVGDLAALKGAIASGPLAGPRRRLAGGRARSP